MGGKGSGGYRDWEPCDGSGTVATLAGECSVCGKGGFALNRTCTVPRHRALSRIVQEWKEAGA